MAERRKRRRTAARCYLNFATPNGVQQLHVNRVVLVLLLMIFCSASIGLGKGVYYLSSFAYAKLGLYKARILNQELTRRIGSCEKQSTQFGERISDLVAYEDYARLKYGMDPISPDIRKAGVGGRPNALERVEESLKDPVLRRSHTLEQNIQALERQTGLQAKTFSTMMSTAEVLRQRYAQMPCIWPTGGSVTSWFGYRMHPILGEPIFHEGLDISNHSGAAIHVTADGVVSYAGWDGNYGNVVKVMHRASGYSTVYAHMSRVNVRSGEVVKRGQTIGAVGSTGRSTGPHCHYEVKRLGSNLNPVEFILPDDIVVD